MPDSAIRDFFSSSLSQRLYRWASMPYRRWRRWDCTRRQTCPISILFYHRVADRNPNPWTISRGDFQRHIDWLSSWLQFVSLDEVQRRILTGCSPRPAVCITFDDGYAENMDFAVPLLLERRIPFTYFVSWSFVAEQRPFPHDVQRGCPLPVDTIANLRAMAGIGVDIGSHTLNHVDCGAVNHRLDLLREIVDSKKCLEDAVGHQVRYFAFPFGQRQNLSPLAFQLGREAGYHGMCSAFGGSNVGGSDPFHLRRIHGDPRLEYLKNWLDFDPRLAWSQIEVDGTKLKHPSPVLRSVVSSANG